MNPTTSHPEYDAALPAWLRARDVLAGEDAVKSRGTKYMPRLDDQSDEEYAAYLARGAFFNATARTRDAFQGLVFRKPAEVKAPPQCVNDVDLAGTHAEDWCRWVLGEVIGVGRCGTVVDWCEAESRAYVANYQAEAVVNWRVERRNGRPVLSLVVVAETVLEDTDDLFAPKPVEQWRVLRLEPEGCVVEVWRRQKDGQRTPDRGEKGCGEDNWVIAERWEPRRRGKRLPFVPFVFHGPRHARPDVDKLPLADLISVNLDHYRLDVDYKHGMHFTALPTAWVAGFEKGDTLRIGSRTAWVSETPGSSAGYLEFKGQGLDSFVSALERDERLMAAQGARMLQSEKRVGETVETIELRQSGENSVLGHIVTSVAASLTHALQLVVWWEGTGETPREVGTNEAQVALNTDFSTRGLTAQELSAVVAAWESAGTQWDASVVGWADVTLTLAFNHGPWPVAALEVFCIIDGGEEGPVGTVASTATAFTHGSVAQGESSLSYRVRYRNGGVIGPVCAWFPWDIALP